MNTLDPCVGILCVAGQMLLAILPGTPPSPDAVERERASLAGQPPAIVVDAGHGGKDPGAKRNGLVEKHLSLDIAERLRASLERAGFPVVMTRTGDSALPLAERVRVANGSGHALLVSIHLNDSPGIGPAGIETYYASEKIRPHPLSRFGFFAGTSAGPDGEGEELAGLVHAALTHVTGSPDRGVRGRGFYVLRHSRCPAILVEAGFLNNPFEATLLGLPAYRQHVADAIAVGIAAYHRTRPATTSPPPAFALLPPRAEPGS